MSAAEQCAKNLPVSLFASVMGMGGLTIAWQRYAEIFGLPAIFGNILLSLAYACFAVVGLVYSYKLIHYRKEVIAELNHPVRANFFPAITIGLLLLAAGTNPLNPALAAGIWVVGTAAHLTFTIIIVSRWITRNYEITHSNPAWFIPVVGNIIVPIFGADVADKEISWFFFSVGLSFWIVLFTIIVYRIIFHHQLAEKFVPTLFILIAPPAVGFISYLKLTGHFDPFARILLYLAVFLFLLLMSMFPYFFRVRFYVSWWAYTFPLCALTIAAIAAFKHTDNHVFAWAATVTIAVSTFAVALVSAKTLAALKHGTLCMPEE
jgi:tellurite resistance protein